MNPIDTQIKEYYQKQSLPEEQLAALRPPEDSPAPRPWLLPFTAAAAVVMAIFLWKPADLPQAVATEIAKNHNAHHPMEFRSSEYPKIAAALDRLQFPLMPPDEEFRQRYTLVAAVTARFEPSAPPSCASAKTPPAKCTRCTSHR